MPRTIWDILGEIKAMSRDLNDNCKELREMVGKPLPEINF